MRIAICFFGLTHSLEKTIDSIEKNIYYQLTANKLEFDIYVHSYDLEYITCTRSGEQNCKLNPEEYQLLNPTKYIIDNQDEFDNSFDYNSIYKYGDIWKTNFQNIRNLMRQLNSLKRVTELCLSQDIEYECYLYVRADLLYHDPLDITLLQKVATSESPIYISPSWAKYGGLNDRFGIGNREAMNKIGNRFDDIYDFCNSPGQNKTRPIHAEQLMKYVCDRYNIKTFDMSLRASRVRANGKIHKEIFK